MDVSTPDFGKDVFEGGRVCDGDKPYFLVGARIPKLDNCALRFSTSPTYQPEPCDIEPVKFEKLYNIDKLGEFDLSIADAVFNARNSWLKNGKQNNWDAASFDHSEELQSCRSHFHDTDMHESPMICTRERLT